MGGMKKQPVGVTRTPVGPERPPLAYDIKLNGIFQGRTHRQPDGTWRIEYPEVFGTHTEAVERLVG